jgi:hypothetical protein
VRGGERRMKIRFRLLLVQQHASETRFLEVEDAGILADIDDAEAYRALVGSGA